MEPSREDQLKGMMSRYKEKLEQELEQPHAKSRSEQSLNNTIPTGKSREYEAFKRENIPGHATLYEQACRFSEGIIKLNPSKAQEEKLRESLTAAHLLTTPQGVASLSLLFPFFFALLGFLLVVILPLLLGGEPQYFVMLIFILAALFLYAFLGYYPHLQANLWRLKSSNQMVLCIFYVVTYMRHTSNLENAIKFAADHLAPPLALDLKKVLWDVETEQYESMKVSLDHYLETWKKYNMEFVEAFHLVESSLYEESEDRRLSLLDKSLSVILDETYEKMLHYTHNLKSPITMLHMLGIILPILGLVILPLVVSFMAGVQWYHIALLYNFLLPVGVYFLGKNILSSRPTGYGDTDIVEDVPSLAKYRNLIFKVGKKEVLIKPSVIALVVGCLFLFIGVLPLLLATLDCNHDLILDQSFLPRYIEDSKGTPACDGVAFPDAKFYLLQYKMSNPPQGSGAVSQVIGPYGLGASLLSLSIVLCLGLALGLYFKLRTQNLVKIRAQSKELEKEFASALFQLANRLGDGLPAEIAFSKVASVMQGTVTGQFFAEVSTNLTRMGLEQAIFDPNEGALKHYPSAVIESSMKVLVESAKKGPQVAAQALMNVSRYIKEIHSVNERLKDLMSDIISSMKSQISFLTPAISGIVIGITSMVTNIIGQLKDQVASITSQGGAVPDNMRMMEMFGDGVPTYYFQIVVGIYVIQLVYILTVLNNGIEYGSDTLQEHASLGTNLIRSPLLYTAIAFAIMVAFNIIAGTLLNFTVTS
ncbi:hypothetical protein HZB02_01520 [Candidatus Woesearchaeota archaeon]|nr:hypothetical protein [Candidatus Woesearchaeota archaeon]